MKNLPRPSPDEPRGQMKKRVAPGIWIDMEDHVHYSIPELLEHFGWPDDEENRAIVTEALQRFVTEQFPEQKIFKCE